MFKVILFSIIFVCSFLKAFALDKTQKTYHVNWTCDHLPYSSLYALPSSTQIKVTVTNKASNIKVRFFPDIFQKSMLQKTQSFFKKSKQSSESKYVVEYKECLDNFIKDFRSEVEQTKRNTYTYYLKNTLKNKDFFIKKDSKAIIPRNYPYHRYIKPSKSEYNSTLKSLCEDRQLSSREKIIASSYRFIKDIQAEYQDIYSDIKLDCVKKVMTWNNLLKEKVKCSKSSLCSRIKQSVKSYEELEENLLDSRQEIVSQELSRVFKSLGLKKIDDYEGDVESFFEKQIEDCDFYPRSLSNLSTIKSKDNLSRTIELVSFPFESIKFYRKNKAKMSRSCKEAFARRLMSTSHKKKDYKTKKVCLKYDCSFIEKHLQAYNSLIDDVLSDLFGKVGANYYCKNLEENRKKEGYHDIAELLKTMDQINQCRKLEIGEKKLVDTANISPSVTGIPMNYSLERISAKQMKATLILNFKDSTQADVTASDMHKRVKKCLAKTSTYFKSPTGESITVNILNTKEANEVPLDERPEIVDIEIGEVGMRSHSRKYAANINCAAITHEVLHLMGLCDEYKERVKGMYLDLDSKKLVEKDKVDAKNISKYKFYPSYACRSISKTTSIMSNHVKALDEAQKKKISCMCDNQGCAKAIKHKKAREYLTQTPFADGQYSFRYDFCSAKRLKKEKVTSFDYLKKNPGSLLDTGQKLSFDFQSLEFADGNSYLVTNRYNCSCKLKADELNYYSDDRKAQLVEDCKKGLKKIEARFKVSSFENYNSCPSGMLYSGEKSVDDNQVSGAKLEDKKLLIISRPTRSSLLLPAHFSRIKWGNCKSKVKKYSRCAQNAYLGSMPKDCKDQPDYCKDEKQWLLLDQ
ncbi:MAG: hypothetical protein N4A33_01490 [Bacteriovoracaceae bacterium]|jgi:hypothetical protein|nr:hypothetical protein [Bacteriovoracaceae bacterium]